MDPLVFLRILILLSCGSGSLRTMDTPSSDPTIYLAPSPPPGLAVRRRQSGGKWLETIRKTTLW